MECNVCHNPIKIGDECAYVKVYPNFHMHFNCLDKWIEEHWDIVSEYLYELKYNTDELSDEEIDNLIIKHKQDIISLFKESSTEYYIEEERDPYLLYGVSRNDF